MEAVFLEVIRESSVLLCANASLLFFITLTLIFPVSSILLSQVFSNGLLAEKLSSNLHSVARAGGLLESPFNRALYLRLSDALLSQALCFPIIITLWLLAKTSILYALNCRHRHREAASVLGFLNEGPSLWSKLVLTYFYAGIMILGVASLALMSPILVVGVIESLDLPRSVSGLIETPLVMLYSVGFAHMLMVLDLANVVSVVENRWGGGALMRAMFLLKTRVESALLLLLVTEAAAFMVEYVFQKRVLGAQMPTSLCEAPLLIFLYSFIHLFHTTMSFVFYDSCLEMDAAAACESPPSPGPLQHLCIAVEVMEQCRKVYTV